eukprot:2322-Heterococcus_DN1.PRE.3
MVTTSCEERCAAAVEQTPHHETATISNTVARISHSPIEITLKALTPNESLPRCYVQQAGISHYLSRFSQ